MSHARGAGQCLPGGGSHLTRRTTNKDGAELLAVTTCFSQKMTMTACMKNEWISPDLSSFLSSAPTRPCTPACMDEWGRKIKMNSDPGTQLLNQFLPRSYAARCRNRPSRTGRTAPSATPLDSCSGCAILPHRPPCPRSQMRGMPTFRIQAKPTWSREEKLFLLYSVLH